MPQYYPIKVSAIRTMENIYFSPYSLRFYKVWSTTNVTYDIIQQKTAFSHSGGSRFLLGMTSATDMQLVNALQSGLKVSEIFKIMCYLCDRSDRNYLRWRAVKGSLKSWVKIVTECHVGVPTFRNRPHNYDSETTPQVNATEPCKTFLKVR